MGGFLPPLEKGGRGGFNQYIHMLHYNPSLKELARNLRRNMTDGERRLWSRLRGKQVLQVQFYRQKPLGEYIVDFYAPKARLVIEVDGFQHRIEDYPEKDRKRDAALAKMGLKVLRFNSREVLTRTDAVVERIATVVARQLEG